ncbi:MAG TPA: hypothetical protein VFL56_07250 [Solirubrobacterales bacterium]|nr:hypothetical protein [Solirubrobacterales bacterium]
MTRRLLVGAGVLALGLLVAALIRDQLLRDTSSPVSVEEAVERAGDGAATEGRVNGVSVPASGVYAYDTRGAERFDTFVSAEHTYPPVTSISVREGGCGILMRWLVLEERETEWDLCPRPGGWGIAGFLEVHEFFGRRDDRRYVCDQGVAFQPRGRWGFRCEFEDTRDEFDAEFVGTETLRVGGRPVETIHVRDRDRLSGHEQGTGRSETWYRARDGLIVRRIAESRDRTPVPGGSGTYSERYELRLRSLRPADPG